MKSSYLFLIVFAGIAGLAASSAIAQEPLRLQFEVTIDGSLVARPQMRMLSGEEGRIELDDTHGDVQMTFAPTVQGDNIVIAFDIVDGDRRLKPRLSISKTVPGTLEWVPGNQQQAVHLTVSWIQ